MKAIGLTVLAVLAGLVLIGAAAAPQLLHFPLHHFSIAPLEARPTGGASMLIAMSLPPTEGFAPNVNVIAQPAPPTIDDYIDASKRELSQRGWKLIKSEKPDDNTHVIEYSGNLSGRSLHWYAKAVNRGNEMLLASATATQQWPDDAAKLQACVDSLRGD